MLFGIVLCVGIMVLPPVIIAYKDLAKPVEKRIIYVGTKKVN